MSSKISILFYLFLGSISGIVVLHFLSNINGTKNGFVRSLDSKVLSNQQVVDLGSTTIYIAGDVEKYIYLANNRDPSQIIRITKNNIAEHHFNLHIPVNETKKTRSLKLSMDCSHFFITDGSLPIVMKGDIQKWKITEITHPSLPFNMFVPTCQNIQIIRIYNHKLRKEVLAKGDLTQSTIKPNTQILEKQIDGIFCTDGMLLYNRKLMNFVYVYFYRNQIILFDKNLMGIKNFRTIDTISRAQIKVSKIASTGSITMSTPPVVVNQESCTDKQWLYIHSRRKADNENQVKLENTSVIDVYNLRNGEYETSFYLPPFADLKMRTFRVYDNKLYSIHGRYLVIREINI